MKICTIKDLQLCIMEILSFHNCEYVFKCRRFIISNVLWGSHHVAITRWFKYYRDNLCVNKSQFAPVIFEPPCIYRIIKLEMLYESFVDENSNKLPGVLKTPYDILIAFSNVTFVNSVMLSRDPNNISWFLVYLRCVA
jgi:hypothetical protein